MLHSAPIQIASSSARRTAPYHTLAARPIVTLPTTTAPGAIQAPGWIWGPPESSDPARYPATVLPPGAAAASPVPPAINPPRVSANPAPPGNTPAPHLQARPVMNDSLPSWCSPALYRCQITP